MIKRALLCRKKPTHEAAVRRLDPAFASKEDFMLGVRFRRLICGILAAPLLLATACHTHGEPATAPTSYEPPQGDNSLHWWGLESIKYDALPTKAFLPKMPWPGDYWATARGGIGHRWQHSNASMDYKDHLYPLLTPGEIAALSPAVIDKLSPAEKYDLWLGRTDLGSVASATGYQRDFMLASARYNRETFNRDEIPGWTGICNGWSLAAMFEPYPKKAVKVKSPAGVEVTFYPGDIQALVSQVYFDYQPTINVARLGALCDEPVPARNANGRIISPVCRDVNPMSFHVALGKYLAVGRPFVFDVEPRAETWNQPVYGYELEFKNKRKLTSDYAHAAPGTVSLVDVQAKLHYIVEAAPTTFGLSEQQIKGKVKSVTYSYTLELDNAEKIVGGEWAKQSSIPDFLWRPDELPTDALLKAVRADYPLSYTRIKELVTASAGSN
ncbi:hypothetical protein [Sorangium sp. So ce145]|uniref:hypothetical protein n=1 Tax=Sorangium sp. So ce145 TaxID=3133285 RepID=UPI003F633BC2